jgi:hypothetical protein
MAKTSLNSLIRLPDGTVKSVSQGLTDGTLEKRDEFSFQHNYTATAMRPYSDVPDWREISRSSSLEGLKAHIERETASRSAFRIVQKTLIGVTGDNSDYGTLGGGKIVMSYPKNEQTKPLRMR